MRITYSEVVSKLNEILVRRQVPEAYADCVASTMASNSLVGTYTHGINRFRRLIKSIDDGAIDITKEAERAGGLGGYEVWDGNMGFGIVNAKKCARRAVELAKTHGIACVALRNTNHWLRGGTYGEMIAEAGMLGICFTNTFNNTVAWGSKAGILGNNPLIMAMPGPDGVIMSDMAMSQFSYGKLELARLQGKQLPYDGGYDKDGNLSRDPQKILESLLIMPAGMWKGSAMALLLDLMTASLSQGRTVRMVSQQGDERGVSQTFIAVNYRAVVDEAATGEAVADTIEALLAAPPINEQSPVRYPGQSAAGIKAENLEQGIPVDEKIWETILAL